MAKRNRKLTEKALNNHSEPSAHEIVIHQLANMHAVAYQKLTSIHVPEETSSFNGNCSLDKIVPQCQRSEGARQTPETGLERNSTELPSWSLSPGSRPLPQKREVIAVTSHSEGILQQASHCSKLKPRPRSRQRKKSKITDDTSTSGVMPQPASRCSQFQPQPCSRQRKKSKIADDASTSEAIPQPASRCSRQRKKSKIADGTSTSEVIPQPASHCPQFKPQPCSRQRKRSKITDDKSDDEVIRQPASRCQGQSRRNNIQRGKLGSKKFELYLEGHWNLLIFCHLGESLQSKARRPCILLLDSLRMANPEKLEPKIRKFVLDIFDAEQRPETKNQLRKIPLLVPKVPQQRNDGDCGIFVLFYINLFLQSAPENFSISEGYPYFMKEDWFTPEQVESFYEELQSTT